MKKALKIIAIVIVLFIVALIVTPILFKGKILEIAKTEANEQLNAKVDFGDVSLSLISDFPNFSVDLSELSVVGIGEFESDTLTSIGNLHFTLDFMSVISGDQMKIKAITIDEPNIHVWVKENGAANYDIAKESDEAEVEEDPTNTEASEPLSLSIESYAINHANISYIDETMDMSVDIRDFTHTGKGDFSQDIFTLITQSSIEAFTMDYEGMDVLKKAEVSLKADIAMDLNAMKFTFMENLMTVNSLGLGFDGWLAMPADDIDMDLKFDMAKNDLLAILSLVPAEFTADLEGVDATGKVAFNGFVKGIYNEEKMPGFGFNLLVDNGRIQYPDLPRSIENIQIDTKINCPEGSADMEQLKVAVEQFYMEIGKTDAEPNTLDAKMVITQAMTNPAIDAKLDANLDLGSFKDVIPMDEEFEMAGKFMAHMNIAGKVDDITNQNFDAFNAAGNASLSQFIYKDETQNVGISDCKIALTPMRLDLNTLQMAYDEMNIQMDGYMEDYVLYALSDSTLVGVFDFKADKVDLNKYMTEEEGAEVEAQPEGNEAMLDTAAVELFLVPNNLDVTLIAEIGEVIYDNMVLDQVNGVIVIKDEIAALENTTFNTLGGSFKMSGSYSTQNHEVPHADFAYVIKDLDIQQAFETFNTIEKIAPIAKYATGKLTTDLILTTDLDAQMNPIMSSINAKGNVKSKEVLMEGGKFLGNLSETLKSPKLAKQKVQDLDANFVIRDGKVTTSPFDVKIDNMEATISGYSTFENEIEYLMEMEIPRDELGGDFNKMAEGLLASANAFLGGNMSMGEYINVDVRIHGALDNPKISPDFAGMGGDKDVKESVKDVVKEEIKEQIEDLKDDAKEEAQKQADKLMKDAKKQADLLVKQAEKAGDDLRKEAKKQGDKLIDDTSNPFAKEAAKLGAKQLDKEADKQAKNLVKEAQKQADKVLVEARKQSDEIIENSLK